MSTTRYLILTTLWTAILPGLIVSTPFLILGCFTPGFFIAASLLGLYAYLYHRFKLFFRKFHETVCAGSVPDSFPVRVLPFFLPLFYVLILALIGFSQAPTTKGVVEILCLWALPQYFPWNIVNYLASNLYGAGGAPERAVLVPLVASAVTTLAGSIYISRFAPPSKHRVTGIALLLLIACVPGLAALYFHRHYRENMLRLDRDAIIVQDEKGRKGWRGDETDLSAFRPFQPDNKLVKITAPSMAIYSGHPRIHGALALYPVYAAAVEAIYRNVDPEDFNNSHEPLNWVQGGTSPAAFESLLAGKSDMIFMGKPSGEQLKEAANRGKTLSITPIADEAFVFFVSKTNPVDDLATTQIRDIYSKRITWWNEVGGRKEKILAFQRPVGSGSQTAMERIMGDVPLADPVQEEFQRSMGGIVNRVADYRNYGNSIGYSFRYYVEGMFKHDGVKLLSVDGVEPTVENIRNGKYPFAGSMAVVTAGSENPNVAKLTDWFLSPQGRDLLERVGYVPPRTTSRSGPE